MYERIFKESKNLFWPMNEYPSKLEKKVDSKIRELYGAGEEVIKIVVSSENHFEYSIAEKNKRSVVVGYFDYEDQYGEIYHNGSAIKFK